MPLTHHVTFGGTDEIVDVVTDHVLGGVRNGDYVLVVASEATREALRGARSLAAGSGVSDSFVELDAAATLDRIMVGDRIDRDAFFATLASVIDDDVVGGRRVCGYGDMVGRLWEAGNLAAALALEDLWGEVTRSGDFSLLCGYPSGPLGEATLQDVDAICQRHTHVVAPAAYGDAARDPVPGSPALPTYAASERVTEVFLPVSAAVPASRHLTGQVLESWGRPDLAWDASLVVSELTTNAVVHAASPFRLSVHRADPGVRIEVEDTAADPPAPHPQVATDPGGRGLALVDALAERSGWYPLAHGKVTWAEFGPA